MISKGFTRSRGRTDKTIEGEHTQPDICSLSVLIQLGNTLCINKFQQLSEKSQNAPQLPQELEKDNKLKRKVTFEGNADRATGF